MEKSNELNGVGVWVNVDNGASYEIVERGHYESQKQKDRQSRAGQMERREVKRLSAEMGMSGASLDDMASVYILAHSEKHIAECGKLAIMYNSKVAHKALYKKLKKAWVLYGSQDRAEQYIFARANGMLQEQGQFEFNMASIESLYNYNESGELAEPSEFIDAYDKAVANESVDDMNKRLELIASVKRVIKSNRQLIKALVNGGSDSSIRQALSGVNSVIKMSVSDVKQFYNMYMVA